MSATSLHFDGAFAGWRKTARAALAGEIDPRYAQWINDALSQPELLLEVRGEMISQTREPEDAPATTARVARAFMDLAYDVSCYRDEIKWALLYRALWRLQHGERHLLQVATDPDVHQLRTMAKAVHRDVHKMRAFVRFREVSTETGPWFVAWFEPQHLIVEANAPFFRDRFAPMRWSILTSDHCAHWDPNKRELTFSEGARREDAPSADGAEGLWLTYYAHIFNPARVKIHAMLAQMPRHYWKNLPEAEIIPELLAKSEARAAEMVERSRGTKKADASDGR